MQLGQIQHGFAHKMVWLWVLAAYRSFWLWNSLVPSTAAQRTGSERLHQGNFPAQRPCRVPSACWGRNLSPSDLCKIPDGSTSGSIVDSSVTWMSCPRWGAVSCGSISGSPCCGVGEGRRAAFPPQEPARSHEAESEPDSAENRSEVFVFFFNFNHDLWQIFFLLSDVPTINRVLGPLKSQ